MQAGSIPAELPGKPSATLREIDHVQSLMKHKTCDKPKPFLETQTKVLSSSGLRAVIPGSETYSGEVIGYSFLYAWASLVAQMVSACNVGDLGSIPGLERSPGEGKGCPLQYSGLENSMD